MRTPSRTMSRRGSIVCPACGSDQLERPRLWSVAVCRSCGGVVERAVLKTLERIAALPEPIGAHPCECGHPEMRLLPDGIFHCPACGSEVFPMSLTGGGRRREEGDRA